MVWLDLRRVLVLAQAGLPVLLSEAAAEPVQQHAVAEETQEGNELQQSGGDRNERVFDGLHRFIEICFFFVDQRGLLRGGVDAPVFFKVEMARIARAGVTLFMPAWRVGINQDVVAVRAEMRVSEIDAATLRTNAG